MLQVRLANQANAGALPVTAARVVLGLREDTDYALSWPKPLTGERLFIDDVEVSCSADGLYRWRPQFYAGRVLAEVVGASGVHERWWLDVGPSVTKSGDESFAEMVNQIRAFDAALLGGQSAATMTFGRAGQPGLFTDDVLLSRIRRYGPACMQAMQTIARMPHRSITAESDILPLSRIRRLHVGALRDRRLAAIGAGKMEPDFDPETLQLRSLTSTPTFDTPANRALLALLKRLLATVVRLKTVVAEFQMGAEQQEQASRAGRRMADLRLLEERIRSVMTRHPFSEVTQAQTSATGLTQIAAHPAYNRAYRLGCMALATGVQGDEVDALHVSHSWGIYETWCYLAVLRAVGSAFSVRVQEFTPTAVAAQFAHRCQLPDGRQLELYFQALFPSASPKEAGGRIGWSISRERRPDLLLVLRDGLGCRSMVLDAKWRSGRDNVLQAMESAHIYHDALRLAGQRPSPCVLLLPGPSAVASLETSDYLRAHEVGALSEISVGAPGLGALAALLAKWAQPVAAPAAPS